ncbi:MAG: 50S ribosomal protein L29 [Gammaproteobacteria bacterium]|nr:50S ribosomal protein L29 [Gammaproteobacteria bacterium]MDH5728674.1 50S ribosomal protein L29 [Gammaproteobacteria bacterium]
MKASEYRSQDVEALKQELVKMQREHFNLRVQKATGQLGRSHELVRVRKSIARCKTILNEKLKGAQ